MTKQAPSRPAATTAKLFKHGRSQAVRLPKAFRFEGDEVRVRRLGRAVILEPIEPAPFDAEAFWAEIDALGGKDFMVDGPPEDPPLQPDNRVFFDE